MRVSENLSKNGIGVEVTDFSLSDLTEENISFLRSKWVEYGLIVFPELPLSHDEFKDFALSFGDFGDDPFISSLPDYPNIAEIKRSANEKATPFGGTWHSDWSFMKKNPLLRHYCIQKLSLQLEEILCLLIQKNLFLLYQKR